MRYNYRSKVFLLRAWRHCPYFYYYSERLFLLWVIQTFFPYCCWVAQLCPTLCHLMDCSLPGFSVLHHPLELAQTHVHWICDATQQSHLLLSLLLLSSIFPSIRVFSNEPALCIKWLKDWSFSFSISLSNEYSGLIFFRINWFDIFAVQGTFKTILQQHNLKASILWHSAFFMVQLSHQYILLEKT